jgi:hypothetical protein
MRVRTCSVVTPGRILASGPEAFPASIAAFQAFTPARERVTGVSIRFEGGELCADSGIGTPGRRLEAIAAVDGIDVLLIGSGDLTTDFGIPGQVDHPRLRVARFSGAALTEGIEKYSKEGVPLRVYSAAKTVADCFKYRNKVGIDVAKTHLDIATAPAGTLMVGTAKLTTGGTFTQADINAGSLTYQNTADTSPSDGFCQCTPSLLCA